MLIVNANGKASDCFRRRVGWNRSQIPWVVIANGKL
jgi:hypothetical protein